MDIAITGQLIASIRKHKNMTQQNHQYNKAYTKKCLISLNNKLKSYTNKNNFNIQSYRNLCQKA